jgi:hypothetical protein
MSHWDIEASAKIGYLTKDIVAFERSDVPPDIEASAKIGYPTEDIVAFR